MKCPMKAENYHVGKGVEFGECEGNECAWWDYDNYECSLLSINRNLMKLVNK